MKCIKYNNQHGLPKKIWLPQHLVFCVKKYLPIKFCSCIIGCFLDLRILSKNAKSKKIYRLTFKSGE